MLIKNIYKPTGTMANSGQNELITSKIHSRPTHPRYKNIEYTPSNNTSKH